MSQPTIARSISRSIWDRVRETGPVRKLHAVAVFRRTCYLAGPGGEVIALVIPDLGDGPLNVVVDALPGVFDVVESGAQASFDGHVLRLGGLRVDLEPAAVWEPRPDWDGLRASRGAIAQHLLSLRTRALDCAVPGSLLDLLAPPGRTSDVTPISGATLAAARKGAAALGQGWAGDSARLWAGGIQLAGMGGGLTPAGDDFVVGVMVWAWLAHSEPASWCEALSGAVAPQTTTLSAAFVQAAAKGECSAAWHRLLATLAIGTQEQLPAAVRGILSHGHTSGADALAGFLWMSLLVQGQVDLFR